MSIVSTSHKTGIKSVVKGRGSGESQVPLWLITFTDVMALMLTFFVLLYAMSVPEEDKWSEISTALSNEFNKKERMPYNPGTQDVIQIDKVDTSKALNLNYLNTLVSDIVKKENVDGVTITNHGKRMIISLPSALLFNSGSVEVKLEGKKALFSIAGVLDRIKNRIEIIGHTDPGAINGNASGYSTNWELSLARAMSVATSLYEVGYSKDVVVRGLSSGLYNELPDSISQEERYALSRRVDIIVMQDSGNMP
ncbi:MAG: OmpA family protein [Alphaproteobacteria bacterium]|nr:OmpA family protein [Alphaproteobacteria bacterium]